MRSYRLVRKDGSECRLFFNDGIETIDTLAAFPDADKMVFYDPWRNELQAPEIRDGKVRLRLNRQQLVVLVSGNAGNLPKFDYGDQILHELPLRYDISMKEAGKDTDYRLLLSGSEPVNLLTALKLTRSCAEFRYDSSFETDDPSASVLEIPHAGDCAELWINEVYCGSAIGPVCRFDIRGKLRKGKNTLSIVTADNPSYSDRTVKSGLVYGTKLPAMAHGFTGHIRIGKEQ